MSRKKLDRWENLHPAYFKPQDNHLMPDEKVFMNNLYQVNVRFIDAGDFTLVHLSIKRRDKLAHRD